MVRPTFLIAEPQPSEGISARKLILESERYNVITAYSGPEALQMVDLFPAVNGVVVHAGLGEDVYAKIIEKAAASDPRQLIILISPGQTGGHKSAHYHLSSHDPKQLLDVLLDRFGRPD